MLQQRHPRRGVRLAKNDVPSFRLAPRHADCLRTPVKARLKGSVLVRTCTLDSTTTVCRIVLKADERAPVPCACRRPEPKPALLPVSNLRPVSNAKTQRNQQILVGEEPCTPV